jgi:hypothetical protein
MIRRRIAGYLLVLVPLAAVPQWIPWESQENAAWGLGSGQQLLLEDRALSGQTDDERRALLYSKLGNSPTVWGRALELIRSIQKRAEPSDIVQVRGAPRTNDWIFAYHLYPLEIRGRFYEEGGREDDALDPEADWLISSGRRLRLRKIE